MKTTLDWACIFSSLIMGCEVETDPMRFSRKTTQQTWRRLAFVPLAKDVDEEKLRRTVATTKRLGTEEEFVEVISTMLSMAQLRKDRPEFVNVIRKAAGEENGMRHPWYEDGFAKGELKGRVEGKVEGLAPFVFAFEKRLGRALRARERERLAKRLTKDGPEKLGSMIIDYRPEELDAWLAPRKAKAVRSTSSSNITTASPRGL